MDSVVIAPFAALVIVCALWSLLRCGRAIVPISGGIPPSRVGDLLCEERRVL